MITWVHYELAVFSIITPAVLFYLFLFKHFFAGKKNSVIGHLTYVLVIMWAGYLVRLVPEMWETSVLSGVPLPPLSVLFDLMVSGYIIGILWNLWWGEKDVTFD